MKKNVVNTLVPLFLNGYSSFLQVTRTTIEAWRSLNFCQIQQLTTELAAFILKGLYFFSVAIDLILFKLAYKKEIHNILDEFQFWPDWTIDNIIACL